MRKYLISILLFISSMGFAMSPPPASEVFQVSVKRVDPNTFSVQWKIKKNFLLYKSSIHLKETTGSNAHLGDIRFPDAEKKTDRLGKTRLVYLNQLTLPVSILGEQAGESLLDLQYQGCADDGFCYPPQTAQIKLTIDTQLALSDVVVEAPPSASSTITPTEHEKLDLLFSTNNWVIIILSFFGFGLLLAFTPCVLPMVPVLSGIIVGHGKNLSTHKAFFLSLSYVLSMSVTYAVVGAVVALMGNNLQIAMQSPWALSIFSLIFVLLALSMFNFYELRLPVSFQSKLASITRSHSTGHYLGAAIMGCLSTLILSPCVTAPLIGALGYIAQSGNVLLGTLALFFLGFGMGTPLLLIGTSAGKLLPKTGHWMNVVKGFLGVMLLAVAIYLMDRILPAVLTMGLWASLLIFSAIYIGALNKAGTHQEKFRQGLGIILLVYGLLILVGASLGHKNPLKPLAPLGKCYAQTKKSPIVVLKTINEVQEALTNAKGKPVMLDFYADWCASCKVIAATTLKNHQVKNALSNVVVLKVDLTANNAETRALLHFFDVVAPPTFLFFNAAGEEIKKLRLVGDVSATTFYTNIHSITES